VQYMLLIYEDQATEGQPIADDVMAGYMAFGEEMQAKGSMVAGEALQPTSTATTVRVRGNETRTTDGPFAETEEVLGGFYIVNVDNLDEAIAVAAKIPGASTGSVEVRPVMVFD
jgi:hypothetical protein